MKKIIFALAVVLAGLSMQSCSLHDETDVFGQPAAERVDEAIKSDKQLLESSPNGWKLTYYTGEDYSGGGYTYLIKFHNGNATVAGDMAGKADSTCTSSYNVIADQSIVLTFDTHNPLIHKFGTPTSSSISGEEGDYEFIVLDTKPDSIFLQGRKWGNKMVMSRIPENVSWTAQLDSIQKVADGIYYNNRVVYQNDSIGTCWLDDYTRRAVVRVDGDSISLPYTVSTTGVSLMEPVTVKGEKLQEFTFDKDTHVLTPKGQAADLSVNGYLPEDYQYIDFFEGPWNLICHSTDDNNNETQTALEYRIEFTYYSPIYLKGKININGLPFDLFFRYDRKEGAISLVQQYADDPSKQYAYANVAPVSFAKGGRFNWTDELMGRWNEQAQMVKFKNSNPKAQYPIDSYVFLATNNAGSPVYENGNLVSLAALTYIQGMTKVK